ncbi:T9SS type A sorting domain-containing protein [bacterium]|nr:T9SS type A sorting domain-containing protein [bacterium]
MIKVRQHTTFLLLVCIVSLFAVSMIRANHVIVIDALTFNEEPVLDGWEIGVFTEDNILAGAVVWREDADVELVAQADDPETEEVDGFVNGEQMEFRLWDPDADEVYNAEPEFIEGPDVWVNDGVSLARIHGYSLVELTIHLEDGWNMISFNVRPLWEYYHDNPFWLSINDVVDLFREGEHNHLYVLKDERGDFCVPNWGFFGLDYWNLLEGYLVCVYEEMEITIVGVPIHPQTEIELEASWNLIAYLPDYDLDASYPDFYVLSSIIDHVFIAKDGDGNFMSPWGVGMPPWTPGQGYQVLVDEAVVLVYPGEWEENARVAVPIVESPKHNYHWTSPAPTGDNMSLFVTSVTGLDVEDGDQIAAFSTQSGKLVGVGSVYDGRCGLAVWGDDVHTGDMVEGLQSDEEFELRLWDEDNRMEIGLKKELFKQGSNLRYETNSFVALDVSAEVVIPDEYYLSHSYPNPFNAVTRMSYGLPEEAYISICVYDVTGRIVAVLVDAEHKAGRHTITWDGGDVSSGVYLFRMDATGFSFTRKVILAR